MTKEKCVAKIEIPIRRWHTSPNKKYLHFDSMDDEIFDIRYTKDNRLIIEQIGWIIKFK